MKFLCDRCKTRYSIADERVRGKILKIRCKNCSNVITVREGMPEPEPEAPAVAEARRVTRPTDYAPSVTGSSPLQAAFAQAMVKPAPPPSQLEEEWYVSLDGDQQGPFTLVEAQAWIGAKRGDDELFCWCEGFDDWLPVEKVSHFRGLRGGPKRARTPTGQALTGRPPPPPPPAKEEEPKPLFAAVLAALEADVAADTSSKSNGARAAATRRADTVKEKDTRPEPAIPATPPAAVAAPATAFGTALPPPRPATLPPPTSAVITPPSPITIPAPMAAAPVATATALTLSALPLKARATPLTGSPVRAKQATGASGLFDQSEEPSGVHDPADSPLSPMFPALDDDDDDAPAAASTPTGGDAYDGDDGEFAIGEVSRVVRLSDVAARVAASGGASAAAPAARRSAQLGRGTAAVATGALSEAAQAFAGSAAPASALAHAASAALSDDHHEGPAPDGGAVLAPISMNRPGRSHAPLFAAGAVLLAAVVGLIIYFATSGSDDDEVARGGGTGGDVEDLGYRSDDPRYPRGTGSGTASGTSVKGSGTGSTTRGTGSKPRGTGTGTASGTGTGTGTGTSKGSVDYSGLEPLSPDDVIILATKMSSGTQRCYGRAIKNDPFLKVKSIGAVISVDPSGKVNEVSLDAQQSSDLGLCLMSAIKKWPFRKSTAGINTKITLKFEQIGP